MLNELTKKLHGIIETIKSDRPIKLLLIILLFAAFIRYWGISNAENTDEYNEVFEALRIGSGHLNLNRWIKKGYQTFLAVEYGIYFILGWLAGAFKNPLHFASLIVADMDPLFLIGRATTATLGIASVFLTFLLGKTMFNKKVGIIGALFFSVIPVHVWVSHLVNTDVPMTFFSLLSLLFIWNITTEGKPIWYALASFFMAIAISCKTLAVPLIVPFLIAHIISWRNGERNYRTLCLSKEIGYSVIFFMVGFVISNPAIVVGLREFINSFSYQADLYKNYEKFDAIPYSTNAYYSYYMMLQEEYGLPLFVATVLGAIYSLIKRTKADYILLSLCITHFLLISNTNFLVQDRYMMLLVPASLILSARCLDVLSDRIMGRKLSADLVLIAACIMLVLSPAYNSMIYVISLTEENTSKMSKKWIEDNIPSGSKILMDAGRTIISSGPRLNQSHEKMRELLDHVKRLKEGETYDSIHVRMVDSYAAIYFELLLKTNPKVSYDITTTELGRNVETAGFYKENKFEYFIHNTDLAFRIQDPIWRKMYPQSASFYDSLDKNFTLVKTVAPSDLRSGSAIKIYMIQ